MKGFVRNDTETPVFKAQRSFPQGARAFFEDLLPVYSKKSGCEEVDLNFVRWLRDNIFTGPGWGFYDMDGEQVVFENPAEVEAVPSSKKKAARKKKATKKKTATKNTSSTQSSPREADARGAGRKLRRQGEGTSKGDAITASEIVKADFMQAKPMIDKCSDKSVLSRALTLSRHFANKEDHMRHILKRQQQV